MLTHSQVIAAQIIAAICGIIILLRFIHLLFTGQFDRKPKPPPAPKITPGKGFNPNIVAPPTDFYLRGVVPTTIVKHGKHVTMKEALPYLTSDELRVIQMGVSQSVVDTMCEHAKQRGIKFR